jgi:hypothetical protein
MVFGSGNKRDYLVSFRGLEIIKLPDSCDKCRSDFSLTAGLAATTVVGLKTDLNIQRWQLGKFCTPLSKNVPFPIPDIEENTRPDQEI